MAHILTKEDRAKGLKTRQAKAKRIQSFNQWFHMDPAEMTDHIRANLMSIVANSNKTQIFTRDRISASKVLLDSFGVVMDGKISEKINRAREQQERS